MRRGNNRMIVKRRTARRFNNNKRRMPLVSNVLSGPSGIQKFQIDCSLAVTPTTSGAWGVQINPGNIISNSVYANLLGIYTKMRVKHYNIRVSYPNSSTNTAGEFKTWLSRDTTSQTALTYGVLSGQHGVKTNKMYQHAIWNWRPVETKDYDLENVNGITDDGILYGGVSVVTPSVVPLLQIRMVVHMYAATFNSRSMLPIKSLPPRSDDSDFGFTELICQN